MYDNTPYNYVKLDYFPPRGSPLTSKVIWHRQSKITKGAVLAGSRRERVKDER